LPRLSVMVPVVGRLKVAVALATSVKGDATGGRTAGYRLPWRKPELLQGWAWLKAILGRLS
jgi:hypothetical protein